MKKLEGVNKFKKSIKKENKKKNQLREKKFVQIKDYFVAGCNMNYN